MPKKFQSKFQISQLRKTRYRYVPILQRMETGELGAYITYGLQVKTVEEEVAFVSDVSTEFEEVRRLADLCTEQELDPIHLQDVIEDFLEKDPMTI